MNNETVWHCKHFTELSVAQLYDILQLRSEVYVVEQQCIFLDMDGIDKQCYHLFGYEQNNLVAYCRLIAPDVVYQNKASIGRVVNAASVRGKGIGKQMMHLAIEKCRYLFPSSSLKIGAQLYLKDWYASFGFTSCNDMYLEDGIEHIHMELIV
ncbi:MAG: GNAT family N-acetyltransferase [Bacteroidota bacterium]|nr:GNAT family N-acetyltransferase [Bacteroidota bacterium]